MATQISFDKQIGAIVSGTLEVASLVRESDILDDHFAPVFKAIIRLAPRDEALAYHIIAAARAIEDDALPVEFEAIFEAVVQNLK